MSDDGHTMMLFQTYVNTFDISDVIVCGVVGWQRSIVANQKFDNGMFPVN